MLIAKIAHGQPSSAAANCRASQTRTTAPIAPPAKIAASS